MHYSATAVLTLLSAAALAAPTTTTRSTTSQSKGVKLFASGYPSDQKYYLTYQRISQGVNIAIVTSSAAEAPVFWEDGTYKTQVNTDIPGVYPLSLQLAPRDQFDGQYPTDHPVSINVGLQGNWLAIGDHLSGPQAPPHSDPEAEYMICDRKIVLGNEVDLKVVRIKYTGESVPEGCSVVQFKPECATLQELPAGSSWDHDHAVTLDCSVV